jgi:hypothetical protein
MNNPGLSADLIVGTMLVFTGVFSLVYFKNQHKARSGLSQRAVIILSAIMAAGGVGILCLWLSGK